MAEDLDDGEFWLPSQFLTDDEEEEDYHHHLLMNKIHSIRFGSFGVTATPLFSKRPTSPATTMMMMMSSTTPTKRRDDNDNDRENHLTGPTYQIPLSKQKERVIMPGSPKSPLCDIGNWSAFSCSSGGGGEGEGGGGSSRASPICSSLVSSPPSSTPPLQNVKQEDPLDVLNAAAGQIGRLKMNEEEKEEEEEQVQHNHHSDLLGPSPPPLEITTPVSSSKVKKNLPKKPGLFSNEALIQQQLQNAHQFQQLKQQQQQQQQSVLQQQQQQLLRQQLSAAWGWQRKVVVPPALPQRQQQQQQQQVQSSKRCARPLGMASSLHHHQQQGSGTSKESSCGSGTGVFIPRRRISSIPTAETPKKPAGCPAVLVPAKVVQAPPNLSFNTMGGDTGGVLTSNEHVKCSSPIQQTRTASDAVILSRQQHHPQNVASHEICLPKEWTY